MTSPTATAAPPWTETPAYVAARQIVRQLRDAGHGAFFAGGCVRDLLLGVPPQDFDVATSATPDVVLALFPRTFAVGAHFGVILVCQAAPDGPDGQAGPDLQTEVATFRHDGVYTDGRRPDAVQFTTDPREDVLRRDFTVNGMLLDPLLLDPLLLDPLPDPLLTETAGIAPAVLDFVGGQEDLRLGLIRAIGDPSRRFAEDKLRMLRAVRFTARLGFTLDPATLRAIQQAAADVTQVSSERIRDELTKMLTEGHAREAFELLDQSGLLAVVLPEAVKMHGVQQPPDWHPEGDVWIHTMILLQNLGPGCPSTLAWGALLHDIGKPATYHLDRSALPNGGPPRIRFNGHVEVGVRIAELILQRLRFSNEDTDLILALVKNHMRFGDLREMKESTLRRFLRLPHFDQHLRLHWLDCSACHNRLGLWEFARERFYAEPVLDQRPPNLVTGRHLIAAGYRPSPRFKDMLEAAEDAQLEGRIASTDEGLTLIQSLFGPPESPHPRPGHLTPHA